DGETHFLSPPDRHDADVHAARGQGRDAVPFLQESRIVSARIGRANPGPHGPTVEVVRESGGAGQRFEVDIANGRAHDALVARQGDELFLKILGSPYQASASDCLAPTNTSRAREETSRSNHPRAVVCTTLDAAQVRRARPRSNARMS